MATPGTTSHSFKVVVAGPFASGKSTLIRQISDSKVVGTEAPTTGLESEIKDTTTVGMEYGTLTIGAEDMTIELSLFGVPGQERFRFMWDIVAPGADGFLLLVDATDPTTWAEATAMAERLRNQPDTPLVVGINRCGADEELFERAIAELAIPSALHIPVEAVVNQSARDAVIAVLLEVLDRIEAEHGPGEEPEPVGEAIHAPDDLAELDALQPLGQDPR